MSFIPAVSDFRNSFRVDAPPGLSPFKLALHVVAMFKHLSDKGTITLIQTNASPTTKLVKRQLPRARKARVRLRQHNKLRAAAVRNN